MSAERPGGQAAAGAPAMRRAHAGVARRELPYPDVQHNGVDWNELMSRQHTIHGLVEFDVTETRRAIHAWRRRTGESLSFTALMVASFARAVGEDPTVQAYRKGKSRLVVFEDVDVAVLVEHIVDGVRVPIPHVVREANRKSPAEVEWEIRSARDEERPYARARRFAPLWLALPALVRRSALRLYLADPHRRRRLTGTVAVTAVGMFGSGTGWGIPFISHSMCLTVGGVGRKPGLNRAGALAIRDVACLTLSVDHDVVNGAPLARFISRFRGLVESASLLA